MKSVKNGTIDGERDGITDGYDDRTIMILPMFLYERLNMNKRRSRFRLSYRQGPRVQMVVAE